MIFFFKHVIIWHAGDKMLFDNQPSHIKVFYYDQIWYKAFPTVCEWSPPISCLFSLALIRSPVPHIPPALKNTTFALIQDTEDQCVPGADSLGGNISLDLWICAGTCRTNHSTCGLHDIAACHVTRQSFEQPGQSTPLPDPTLTHARSDPSPNLYSLRLITQKVHACEQTEDSKLREGLLIIM